MRDLSMKDKRLEKVEKEGFCVYPRSVQTVEDSVFAMVHKEKDRLLFVEGKAKEHFHGEALEDAVICPLSSENAEALRQFFPYTRAITRPKEKAFSMGFGDRLGWATPGHIQSVREYDVFPVFAQQSIRELDLSGRSYEDVMAAATFAVFQCRYEEGFGADGDHLKTLEEIEYAIESGMTMITLDCSEHIHTEYDKADSDVLDEAYAVSPEAERIYYENKYLDQDFPFIGKVGESELRRFVLLFHDALQHAFRVHDFLTEKGWKIDLEISIDETPGETSPFDHFLIAKELADYGVEVSSMAPHFSGSFEKGVDYRGNIEQFRAELIVHQAIAEEFGYRLSLHSGSDKFSIFPTWGEITKMHCHVKVAGTNWLEALAVIAEVKPSLFRAVLEFAMEHRQEAEQYYHISSSVSDIVDPSTRSEAELSLYLGENAARQTLHITYGILLHASFFRDAFFDALGRNSELYNSKLEKHMRKHLEGLLEKL